MNKETLSDSIKMREDMLRNVKVIEFCLAIIFMAFLFMISVLVLSSSVPNPISPRANKKGWAGDVLAFAKG